MRRRSPVFWIFCVLFAALGIIYTAQQLLAAGPLFTAGNILVERFGDGSAAVSSAATAVFVDEVPIVAGSVSHSVAMPTSASGSNVPLTVSGTAASEGALMRSLDGRYVTNAGYNAVPTTVTPQSSTTIQRVVGRIAVDGTVDTSTHFGDSSYAGSNIRGAVSDDGTHFWIGGTAGTGSNAGIRYAVLGGSTSTQLSSSPTNVRWPGIFGGQLYISSASGAFRIASVGTGVPTTGGQTITNLSGFPTSGTASPYGFVILDLNSAVPGVDTAYVADDQSAASGGGIQKWTYNGTTWSLAYTIPLGTTGAGGARGLTAVVNGAVVTLYATTTETSSNRLVQVVDTGSASTFATLATAPTNTVYRGVAFAPQSSAVVINIQPQSQGIPAGTTATLTVAAASSTNSLSYQWYQGAAGDTSTLVGTNSASFTTPTLSATTSYWVRVSNSQGSADSAAATIAVSGGVAPTISQDPQGQTINSGQTPAALTVVASGTAPLSYQWYQGAAGITTTPVGTNSSSFSAPALSATTSYWVRVSNGVGSADSAVATITVITTVAPSISQNPQNQSISSGQTATLTVVASGTAPLSYQWYQGAAGVATTPVGTNSSSFATPSLTATTSYWVRISNAQGIADSTTAVVTVVPVSTPLSGTGSAVLAIVPVGGTTQLTVNVTPATNPDSTNITVTGDLSTIGGSSTQGFSGTGNTFSFAATVTAATLGPKTLPITVSDAEGHSTGLNISLTVTAPLSSSPIVISQVYGGGGNSGALYTNDFVQLYNRSNTTVDTTGWSLQYAPATGTGDWTGRQPLGGLIGPGQYYLIALASGGSIGSPLPPANVTGQINIAQGAGKLALVDNGDLLTGASGCSTVTTHIKDLVGYGSTADCWEGTGPAVVPQNLTTISLFRQGAGSVDTNDNKTDFFTAAPNPVSTTPIVPLPPAVFTTYPTINGGDVPLDATIEVTFTQTVTLDPGWFDISCATTHSHNDVTEAPDGTNHWITPNTNFLAGEACTVTVFKAKVRDAATGLLSPLQDYTWSFTVALGAPAPETPAVHLLMGNPTGAVADVSQPNNYLMSKPQYALSYNRDLGRPNWVSWHLTNAWIPSSHPARVDTFRPDPAVPPNWYRVQSFDFFGSGFDRGHMDPNADREDTIPDNQATFLMSNMVAQAPDNNQGPWADFENYLRSVVRSSPTPNEIYIVSGPAGTGGTGSGGAATTVAGGHVTVPAYTWKVALVLPDDGAEDDVSRVNCSTTTIAIIMPNVQGIRNDFWNSIGSNGKPKYLTTVDAVETLTGYHFFTNLPQPIQHCIKAGTNGVNPKNDQTIDFVPIAGATVGDLIPLQATASSGLAVSFEVTAGSATIVNGTTLHVTGAGSVSVKATQAGDVNYYAAPEVSQTIAVARATPAITWPTPADIVFGTALSAVQLNATAEVPGAFSYTPPTGTMLNAGNGQALVATFAPADTANYTSAVATVPINVLKATATINVPAPITVEAMGASGAAVTFTVTATDAINGIVPVSCVPASGSMFAVGTTQVACTAEDDNHVRAQAAFDVAVVDTTAPVVTAAAANPPTIWPPNRSMIAVTVTVSATDAVSATTSRIVSITGNDGATSNDWQITGPLTANLRADRTGAGSGRTYTLTVETTDTAHNVTRSSVQVVIPHDQGK